MTMSSSGACVANPAPPEFRVREPADLLVLVPYLLGFHPTDSVVIVLLDFRRLVLTARIDLERVTDADALQEEVDHLCDRTGATKWVVIGYGQGGQGRSVLAELAAQDDPGLTEALWVESGRWWGLMCPGDCCPPEGQLIEPTGHPMVAEAVYAGLTASADRSSIAALAAGPAAEDVPRLLRRIDEVRFAVSGAPRRSRQRRMDRLIRSLVDGQGLPDEDQALQLAVLSDDVQVRDVAFALMTRDQADRHVAIWSAVVLRTPDSFAAAPLCLQAVAGWLSGNGALLNCCIERLDVIDPSYPMAAICRDISAQALPSTAWAGLATRLLDDLTLMPQ